MTEEDFARLDVAALRVRDLIVRMLQNKGIHIGSALSCVDLLVYLYYRFLRINQQDPTDPQRDYLFFSKGHGVLALYGTLLEMGWLSYDRFKAYTSSCDILYWHPSRGIPGVEFHSGSLGHLLPVAVGVALDCKLRQQPNRVVVVTGDGELNAGSNWEACLVARAHGLNNLYIVVDRNRFQSDLPTEQLMPLEPLEKKFKSFGCGAVRVNGHDFLDLEEAFAGAPYRRNKPTAIIAETVRGHGIPSIESRPDRLLVNTSEAEVEAMLRELHNEYRLQHSARDTMERILRHADANWHSSSGTELDEITIG